MNVSPLRRCPRFALALALASCLPAQAESTITEERVLEVVSWIASDERMGRATPSPGLEATAAWLERQFEAAGLEPGVQGQWRHRYELDGQRLDSRTVEVTVELGEGDKKQRVVLAGDKDVRLLSAAASADGTSIGASLMRSDDPRLDRWFGTVANGAFAGRVATLLEVAEDHPFWLAHAGVHERLMRRLRAAAPVFLVRKGALPEVTAADDTAVPCTVSWKGGGGEKVAVELANVVGVLRGSELPDEYVMVSAHYDHIGLGAPKDGDMICNGADDDGTGTTAVVLLAGELAKRARPKRSIAFVCFSAEEQGLLGSRAFAEHPPMPLASVVVDINIEMIGRPEPGREGSAWVTGKDYSDFAAIVAPALQRGGIAMSDFAMAERLFAQSDNLSLARKGVVAHSISASALHSDYHTPGDEVAKLDIKNMTAVIRGLAEVVAEFANRADRPAYSEKGQEFLKRQRAR